MAYRNDQQALKRQCEALRAQLAEVQHDAERLTAIEGELQKKLALLAKKERVTRPGSRTLAVSATLVVAIALTIIVIARTISHRPAMIVASSTALTDDAKTWFAKIRPHCNPLEIDDALHRSPAPRSENGQAYLASCYALAGRTASAQQILDGLKSKPRLLALTTMFNIAHPIADRGDDLSVAPVMRLMVRYQPRHRLALYHAGMAAFRQNDNQRAKGLLERFLRVNPQADLWRGRADRALTTIAGGNPLAGASIDEAH